MDKLKISIRKRKFKNWIYDNELTQPYVAEKLKIPVQEMKDKLDTHEPFSEEQIRNLVYLMGAKAAFKVMYFPTLKEKERVRYETFIRPKENDERGIINSRVINSEEKIRTH